MVTNDVLRDVVHAPQRGILYFEKSHFLRFMPERTYIYTPKKIAAFLELIFTKVQVLSGITLRAVIPNNTQSRRQVCNIKVHKDWRP